MTALEIRLIAYALGFLAIVGVTAWSVHTLDAHHYERLEAADKLAQAAAFQAQQQKTIDDLKAQQAATQAAEKQLETLKAATDGTSRQLSDSVRAYAELRRGLLSATSTAATLADATSKGAQRDSELANLVQQATAGCLNDAAALTALQTWAGTKR